jgi:lipooligosaccharide transport system permease protein
MATEILMTSIQTRRLPKWGQGVKSVWMRNFLHFRYTLWVTLCWIFVEPFLYLLAIGYGIGNYVSDISGKSYIDFYFPALITVTAFSVPFFESTYNYYSKLTHQKTYQTILMTPVSASEILWAELLWGATKGILSCLAISVVARVLGIYHSWLIFPAFLILFLVAFIGSACGLLFTTFARNYDFFNYAISGFLLPMSFFSDTYFPIAQLPWGAKLLIQFFPLIHGVRSVRSLLEPEYEHNIVVSIVILLVFAVILTRWAYQRFRSLIIN